MCFPLFRPRVSCQHLMKHTHRLNINLVEVYLTDQLGCCWLSQPRGHRQVYVSVWAWALVYAQSCASNRSSLTHTVCNAGDRIQRAAMPNNQHIVFAILRLNATQPTISVHVLHNIVSCFLCLSFLILLICFRKHPRERESGWVPELMSYLYLWCGFDNSLFLSIR